MAENPINSKIQLLDSSEFHKDIYNEVNHQTQQFSKDLKNFIFSKKCLILIVWIISYVFTIKQEFGLPYLSFSLIVFIFCNLGKREEGTLSAYSIFNKGFESLPGTFDMKKVDQTFGMANNVENQEEQQKILRQKQIQFEKENKKLNIKENLSKKGNQTCYCGSNKKYKKCCYWRELKNTYQEEYERKQNYKLE
ncbi:hypothetical protein PPERSA_09382 [Pseudocohnilembus persalinus]|uniref:SAYSvFN domain-containing protein n=1 Tax=Pseudocohnilembus persalinus TaxID=266149 RepID=A0A0V0QL46_PSEPJ|nr:hypothetical protein PPERSA_09382 [Pseudocohnilembus persalinus]|eukprot:KRX02964.1 hypothetical protein PPERSA_09382 [Pseudocohnilembus persalinus]